MMIGKWSRNFQYVFMIDGGSETHYGEFRGVQRNMFQENDCRLLPILNYGKLYNKYLIVKIKLRLF